MSGASERANGRASGPVLQSVFLAVLDHSVVVATNIMRLAMFLALVVFVEKRALLGISARHGLNFFGKMTDLRSFCSIIGAFSRS